MKKIWVYILGVLTGVIVTFVLVGILGIVISAKDAISANDSKSIDNLTFFEEPGEVMSDTSYEVFQTLGDNAAIAYGKSLKVLVWQEKGYPYYDGQIINLPNGKCFRQVGIYKDIVSTLPVVTIMDK